MRSSIAVLAACVLTAGCSAPKEASKPADAPPAASIPKPRIPLSELPRIDAAAVLAHTKALSSDAFEGRAPGTKGEQLTVDYLINQFKTMGLTPGNTDGTFVQEVPLVGITAAPAPLRVAGGTGGATLRWKDDVMAWTKHVAPSADLKESELVFVGYGVVAPEYGWDDFKGLDVKGKTLVMLINDPPVAAADRPGELDAKTFGGKAMTYYGRWTYKFESAAAHGAAGAFIIHETVPAGYPFDVVQSSWEGEQFDLVTPDKNMGRAAVEGWLSLDAGKQLLYQAGQDFDSLKKQAATRDFKPVPLGLRASMAIKNTLRTITSKNVIAKLEGTHPQLKDEYVIYTAHWDHLGKGPAVDGDSIYNGAVDNGVGVAGLLEVAHAFTQLKEPPKRTVVFMSVTAEEQGLLGSEYYGVTPIYPLARTLADINMDGLNVWGKTKDITLIGYGASDLDDYAKYAASEQGREVRADPEPEKGFYYRSDHFSFAKQGVPALDPDEGVDYIGKPADFGKKVRETFTARDYHKPSDVVKPDWDLSGAAEDLQLLMAVGYRVAQADAYPGWKPGNEFKAKRDEMLAHTKEVEAWRAKHEADYTREYVSLAGLEFLKSGVNTVGSGPSADVKLPSPAPALVGRVTYGAKEITFEPQPGVPVMRKGQPVSGRIVLKSDERDDYDELSVGDIAFWLHESGPRRAIRIRDPHGEPARTFAGYQWFPIDPRYRVVGKFIKDAAPREVAVDSLTGDAQTYTTEGVVEFTLAGQTFRMRPMTTRPNRFFFIMRDGTSGKETYAAARFLYADLKPDGTTVLDFNQAYNPPCAFNPFTTCPLPPPENRLKVRILAGEKNYAGHRE